jgi:hypothetical protein
MIPDWYPVSQTIICLFAALLFLGIWERGIPSSAGVLQPRKHDRGAILLAGACLVWGLVGAWLWACPKADPVNRELVRTLSSTLNSALFLLALPYFHFLPDSVGPWIKRTAWARDVLIAALVVSVAEALFSWLRRLPDSLMQPGSIVEVVGRLPDFLFSLPTLLLLNVSLFNSFRNRSFRVLAMSSILSIVFVGVVQAWELVEPPNVAAYYRFVLLLTSKTTLIGLLLALEMTWAHEGWTFETDELRHERSRRASS